MALQMSPVDAHHQDQPHCHYQPTRLQIESAGANSRVELSQCQRLDCSPIEQVPLSTVTNSVLPSPREIEQKVSAVEEGFAVTGQMASSASNESCKRSFPKEEDLRGGAAPEIQPLLDVSQSSVIDSSNAILAPKEVMANPGTHESQHEPSSCLIDHSMVIYGKRRV